MQALKGPVKKMWHLSFQSRLQDSATDVSPEERDETRGRKEDLNLGRLEKENRTFLAVTD